MSEEYEEEGPSLISNVMLFGVAAGLVFLGAKYFKANGLTLPSFSLPSPGSLDNTNYTPPVDLQPVAPATYQNVITPNSTAAHAFLQYGATAQDAAASNDIPAPIFLSLISRESKWNPLAVGTSGEIGLTQVMPSTAANPGYGVPAFDPYDTNAALHASAQYLKALFNITGNWYDALAAYNGGLNNVNSTQTQTYAAQVMQAAGYPV